MIDSHVAAQVKGTYDDNHNIFNCFFPINSSISVVSILVII